MSDFRASLKQFGPIGIVAIVVILFTGNIIGAILVLLWASETRTPWRTLGLVSPRNWPKDIAVGLVAGIALKFVVKAIVMPLLGASAINAAYHGLQGNAAALPMMLFMVIVGGGVGEEIIWRGFLFERLRALLGQSARAKIATVLITAALFASAHFSDQGLAGSEQAVCTGLVFGIWYTLGGRLWPIMIAHAAYDVAAVLMIYFGVEESIAGMFFR